MTPHPTKRLLGLLATLAAAAILATGCGSDDKKDTSTGGGATPGISQTDSAPKTKDDAVKRCNDEANKLDGQAKKTAQASCKAIETGNTDDIKAEAKKQCLDATKQIPDANARKQAEEACNKFN